MRIPFLAAASAVLISAATPALAAADPSIFNGSWKSERDVSRWSDGKFPKDFSLTIDLKFVGNALHYHSANDTNKAQPPRILEFDADFSGQAFPIAGSDRYNQVTIRRVSDTTFELLQLKNGDVIVGGFWQLLPDGRLVRWGIAKNPDGSSHSYLEYFHKG